MLTEEYDINKTIKYEYSDGKECIFISYQKKSFDFVIKLSNYLETNSVKTWYAPRNIKLSGLWPEKLEEAIHNSKALLLLYTEDADRSKHVMREVQIADDYNKPIIWLKLDESNPSKTLKYYLSLIQSITINNDEELVFNILLNILNKDSINTEYLSKIEQIETTIATENIKINKWCKEIYVFQNSYLAAEAVARVYFETAKKSNNKTLLLPTGRISKEIFYAMLRIASEYEGCPFNNSYLMNDTETFGVGPNHSTSRIKGINDYLITPLINMNKGPKTSQLAYYYGIDGDEDSEILAREHLKKHPVAAYGISVSPFGEIIGYDIGIHNEDIINDEPRVITINDETKEYIDKKQKTNSIYTVGLKTALESEILMILAFTPDKANAIERLMKEEIDPNVPLTLLRKHPNAYLIVTEDIANKIGLKEYSMIDISPKEVAKCIVK